MSLADAEDRLGFILTEIEAVLVQDMLAGANYTLKGHDTTLKIKENVYHQLLQHLTIEGYPTEADVHFKEANVNDLVYATIGPILCHFIHKAGQNGIYLLKEKEIVSTDSVTGGMEEFVVMDLISVKEKRYIFIIEGKRSSLGEAMKECLLALKDMRDSNGGGEEYGFVTTGESWRMISYNSALFQMTEKMDVIFDMMDEDNERWMKENSILVDCMYAALNNGGIV